jgi:hypothetical protein
VELGFTFPEFVSLSDKLAHTFSLKLNEKQFNHMEEMYREIQKSTEFPVEWKKLYSTTYVNWPRTYIGGVSQVDALLCSVVVTTHSFLFLGIYGSIYIESICTNTS